MTTPKPKRGRPALPEGERTRLVNFRLYPAEEATALRPAPALVLEIANTWYLLLASHIRDGVPVTTLAIRVSSSPQAAEAWMRDTLEAKRVAEPPYMVRVLPSDGAIECLGTQQEVP